MQHNPTQSDLANGRSIFGSPAAVHRNEVVLHGILARDPVIRVTPTGKKVANVTVATTLKHRTEYHRVTAWEHLANKVEELSSGAFVQVVGYLHTRSWEDANKTKHFTTGIVAWQFVVPAKEPVTISTTGQETTDADIPF